jgi:hypothetical protein
MYSFPIDIITNSHNTPDTQNLILEIRSPGRIAGLLEYGCSPLQITKIQENLSATLEKQKKTIIFSHISTEYDTITCFFPSIAVMDDRCELFS